MPSRILANAIAVSPPYANRRRSFEERTIECLARPADVIQQRNTSDLEIGALLGRPVHDDPRCRADKRVFSGKIDGYRRFADAFW